MSFLQSSTLQCSLFILSIVYSILVCSVLATDSSNKLYVKSIQGPPQDFDLHKLPSPHNTFSEGHGGWHLLFVPLLQTAPIPKNAHLYISVLLRAHDYERASKVRIMFHGDDVIDHPLSDSFNEHELYSFHYYERNYEVITGDTDAQLEVEGLHAGTVLLVVVQDFDQEGCDSKLLSNHNCDTHHHTPVKPVYHAEAVHDSVQHYHRDTQQSHGSHTNHTAVQHSVVLRSHLTSHASLFVGEPVAFNAHLQHEKYEDAIVQIYAAHMHVYEPTLSADQLHHSMRHDQPMFDDGRHQDKSQGDGVYGAVHVFDKPGDYAIHINVHGQRELPSGKIQTFQRSTFHSVTILDKAKRGRIKYLAAVEQDKDHDDMVIIHIPYGSLDQSQIRKRNDSRKFKMFTQVWAYRDSDAKEPVPVGYTSGITYDHACPHYSDTCLSLKFSKVWFSRLGIKDLTRFTLRYIFVQDIKTSIPLVQKDELRALSQGDIALGPESKFHGTITERMLKGPRPKPFQKPGNRSILVISHGYCAGQVPFTLDDYDNYITFKDFNANRFNDDFAVRILKFIDTHPDGPFDRYSFVAHSQGGIAATTLYTYYWSGADNVDEFSDNSGRLIQTIGSPYMGTGLAGVLAFLGHIFGIACGSNFDLTHDGGGLWMSMIPQYVREQMYYSTATWKGHHGYCSLPLNSVLSFMNDGTCENQYADVVGAHSVHINMRGWCHTDSMAFPSECTNHDLNHEYNSNAAR